MCAFKLSGNSSRTYPSVEPCYGFSSYIPKCKNISMYHVHRSHMLRYTYFIRTYHMYQLMTYPICSDHISPNIPANVFLKFFIVSSSWPSLLGCLDMPGGTCPGKGWGGRFCMWGGPAGAWGAGGPPGWPGARIAAWGGGPLWRITWERLYLNCVCWNQELFFKRYLTFMIWINKMS